MKRMFLIAALLATQVQAASWKKIYQEPFDSEYPLALNVYEVDTSSVAVRNGLVQAWLRHTRLPGQQVEGSYPAKYYKSSISLSHFDCVYKETATSRQLLYDDSFGSGEVVGTSSLSKDLLTKSMTPVAPGTVGEGILTAVCAMRGKKK